MEEILHHLVNQLVNTGFLPLKVWILKVFSWQFPSHSRHARTLKLSSRDLGRCLAIGVGTHVAGSVLRKLQHDLAMGTSFGTGQSGAQLWFDTWVFLLGKCQNGVVFFADVFFEQKSHPVQNEMVWFDKHILFQCDEFKDHPVEFGKNLPLAATGFSYMDITVAHFGRWVPFDVMPKKGFIWKDEKALTSNIILD